MKEEERNDTMRRCVSILPEFLEYMKDSGVEYKLKFIKNHILLFLKELRKKQRHGFSAKVLDGQFVNEYLSGFMPKKFPNYSMKKISYIKKILKTYIIYLTTENVLKRRTAQEIIRAFQNEQQMKKKVPTGSKKSGKVIKNEYNVNKSRDFITSSSAKSKGKNNVVSIKNEILRKLNPDLDEEKLAQNEQELFQFLNSKSEDLIVETILNLLQSIEDDLMFWNIYVFIQNFKNLPSFPSKIIKTLHNKQNQDKYFFRLLMLYQGLFYSGYILEIDFPELFRDLQVDLREYINYSNKLGELLREKGKNINELPIKLDSMSVEREIEKEIEKIKPFPREEEPINDKNFPMFNFPEDFQMDIKKYIGRLEKILSSQEKLLAFIHNSNQNDIGLNFKESKNKDLIKKAQRNYYDGQYRKALLFINRLVRKVPENSAAHYFKGKVLQGLGKRFYALKSLLRSIERDSLKVEAYMDLCHLLQSGGYFHRAIALGSLMIQIFPFDFNFCMQLAISASQLSYPFKDFLRLPEIIEPARTLNFLTRFWPFEKFKCRDSLEGLGISTEKFYSLFNSAREKVLMAAKIVDKVEKPLEERVISNKLNSIITNPLYFFPEKEDHTSKNLFIYELTQGLAMTFYDLYPNFFYVVASEQFIDLSFQLAKNASNLMIEDDDFNWKEASKLSILTIVTRTLSQKSIHNDSYLNLVTQFITLGSFKDSFADVLYNLIQECITCPNKCLHNPDKWTASFYDIGVLPDDIDEDLKEHINLLRFMDVLVMDFYYFLENKGLKLKTVENKKELIIIFLGYLLKEHDLSEPKYLEKYINPENLKKFLGEFVIQNEIVETKTRMDQMRRALKNFIRFLHKDVSYFEEKEYKAMWKVLNKSDYFIQCLDA
ncbi:MAG: hypothetical protein R6U96_08060 [Promethearchaeia archaeon]